MCARFWEEPILSSGVLKRTLFHIWLRLYLPVFLFNVGLFTLMWMASFVVLARPWSSLTVMLKLLLVEVCPVCCMCTWMGEGARCIFHPESLMCPLITPHCRQYPHTGDYMTPLLLPLVSWSLGFISTCLMVVLPLKYACMPRLLQMFLKLSAMPCV